MDCLYRIIVYGNSAWLTGIATALRVVPNLDVRCINPAWLGNPSELASLAPHVVIMERQTGDGAAIHLLLKTSVIEVDVTRNVLTIHVTRQVTVSSIQELTQIIEEVLSASTPSSA